MVSATVLARMLVTLVLVVSPALLLLGLYRFLEFIKHDELVAQMRAKQAADSPSHEFLTAGTDTDPAPSPGGPGSDTAVCGACGLENMPDATFCRRCLRKLDD
jgi:hypothetical protein